MDIHSRWFRVGLAALAVVLLVAGVIATFTVPTGASTPEGTAPDGARVASSASVGDVRVLLTVRADRLRLTVAYKEGGRWQGVHVTPAPSGATAAWASTKGKRKVPSLSVIYGRVPAAVVTVRWTDGQENSTTIEADGAFLIARPGSVRSAEVLFQAPGGEVLGRVEGP